MPMTDPTREPSHNDIELPQFEGKPHICVQWKGTDVCCDIHCACGEMSHFDGDFFYFFRCPHCGRYWEVGTHVAIYETTKERAKSAPAPTPDARQETPAEQAKHGRCNAKGPGDEFQRCGRWKGHKGPHRAMCGKETWEDARQEEPRD